MGFYPMGREMHFCDKCGSREHRTNKCFEGLKEEEELQHKMGYDNWKKMWEKKLLKMENNHKLRRYRNS